MPKEGSHCICVWVLLIDSVFKMNKNYYLKLLLEECKYIVKEKEVTRRNTEDLEMPSDESEKEESDGENSDKW